MSLSYAAKVNAGGQMLQVQVPPGMGPGMPLMIQVPMRQQPMGMSMQQQQAMAGRQMYQGAMMGGQPGYGQPMMMQQPGMYGGGMKMKGGKMKGGKMKGGYGHKGLSKFTRLQRKRCVAPLRTGCSLSLSCSAIPGRSRRRRPPAQP